jgi:phosphate transport system substrate-binding protein
MYTQNTKKKALALVALMMISALAGCLGDDTTVDDTNDTTNGTDTTTNNTTGGTDNTTGGTDDTTIDVGAVQCGPDGSITIAGSSTVLPLAEAWAEYYQESCPGTSITVESGGSSSGAGRVCANSAKGTPVDIGDMSRDWKATEADRDDDGYTMDCLVGDTSRSARQIVVALDGLSVVMKSGGAAAQCVESMGGLTVDQLRWMFSAETASQLTAAGLDMSVVTPNGDSDDTTHLWSELSADCPAAEIVLAYPDAASGTYEYFFEAVLHEAEQGFRTGTQSADDNVIVNTLVGDETSIGYFGYAYYAENQDTLAAAAVQNEDGTYVAPNAASVADGSYNPLSRPLFMNLHDDPASLAKTVPFLEFGLGDGGDLLVASVGYVALTTAAQEIMETRLDGTAGADMVVCGPSGSISIAGSSTVLPLAEAWAESYQEACPEVSITVESGGSSSGAGRVCANSAKGTPVDIGDMSRDWKATEASRQANGFILDCLVGDTSRSAAQFQVAIDGLSVVVKSGGAAEQCVNSMGGLTPDQLRWMFSGETASELVAAGLDMAEVTPNGDSDDATHKWNELSADCPDAEIALAYPDAASGTYEYFFEAILHEAEQGFRSGQQSADDNVLVNALVGDETAIGYFGYAYYQENQDTLTAVAVENDAGDFIAPNAASVRDGSYNPLSRPLFMNLNTDSTSLINTLPFMAFGIGSEEGKMKVGEVGYVSLNEYQEAQMYMGRWLHLLGTTPAGNLDEFDEEFCGAAQSISIAGSSTVLPLAEAWAEDFGEICDGTAITVESGGSSSGAGRVCANSAKGTPVDIGDMSRDWKSTETQDGIDDNGQLECAVGDTSITVTQLVVAVDGLSVVMKSGGAAQQCVETIGGLSVAQLRWMFSAETSTELAAAGLDMSSVIPNSDDDDATHKWSELDAGCADSEIVLAYPDAASGTYEYFFEAILDEAEAGFRSGTQSADDNVLVNTLTGDEAAIGYFGFAYYAENQATLYAAPVVNDHMNGAADAIAAGMAAVPPNAQTVRDGSYEPLSRPLFMNVNNDAWDVVTPFLVWAYSGDGSAVISEVGYVPLDDATWQEMFRRITMAGMY